MTTPDAGWEARVATLWSALDDLEADVFIGQMDQLAAELPEGSAVALFERGGAFDATGHPGEAVSLYAAALEEGLDGPRRRQAVIQMSSSLRNLGDPQRAHDLLVEEAKVSSDELDGAVAAFLALALADLGREREAVAVAVTALAGYLPLYRRAASAYAEDLAQSPRA
jgi:tetratricopeptide (TPR) repeat protein